MLYGSYMLASLIADAAYGVMAVAGIYGVVILIWGRALTRPTLTLLGLCIGSGLGVTLANLTDAGKLAMVWVLLCAAAGAGLGFVTYRNLMSMMLALVMGITAFWTTSVMMKQNVDSPLALTRQNVYYITHGNIVDQMSVQVFNQQPTAERVTTRVKIGAQQTARAWWQWFDNTDHSFKWPALIIMIGFVLLGMWLGAAEPDISAIIAASLLGAMLIMIFWQVTMIWDWSFLPNYRVRDTRQGLLLTMGLALTGFVFQLIMNWKHLDRGKGKKEKPKKTEVAPEP